MNCARGGVSLAVGCAWGFMVGVLAGPAFAWDTYTWTNSSGGSVADAGNWNVAPTFDANAELLFGATNAPVSGSVVTVDGDRTIGKLNVHLGAVTALNANYTITFAPGTPATSQLSLRDLNFGFTKGNQNSLSYVVNVNHDVLLTGSGLWTNRLTSGGGTGPTLVFNLNGTLTAAAGTSLTLAGGSPINFNSPLDAAELLFTQSQNASASFGAASNALRGVNLTGATATFTFSGNANTIGTNGVAITGGNNQAIVFNGGGNTFNGALDVGGSGTLSLNGASNTCSVTAKLRSSSGTLRLAAQDALGSAALTNSAGTVQLAGWHTIHNAFSMGGNLTLAPVSGVVTYDGMLDSFIGTRTLIVSGSDGVLRFNAAGGLNNNTNSLTGGALEVAASGINLPGGPLVVGGGVLLLNGLSWDDWLAQRAYGTGSGQWQLLRGGFAARGTNALVVSGLPAGTLDNRLTRLGTIARDGNGAYYANAPVDIGMDMVVAGTQTVAVSETGPGLTGTSTGRVIHTISGSISGSGAPQFTYQVGVSEAALPEVILAGTNNAWTGNIYPPTTGGGGSRFNTGRGGLLANQALVRFAGPDSLPNGAVPGTLTYLATWETDGGYILSGSSTGTTYNLGSTRSGYRFLTAHSSVGSVLGVDGGTATLENTILQMNNQNNGDGNGGGPMLLARRGCTLNLGSPGAPLYCVRSYGNTGVTDGGLAGAATVLTQSVTSIKTLYKRGEGTVVVRHMAYKLVDGVTDDSINTAWQIGRGRTGNAGTNAYFDGALREGTPGAAVNRVILAGGVLETTGSYTRTLGNNVGSLQWDIGGGGGFAAYGGNLDVTLSGFSTGNATNTPAIWGSSSRFILSADAMIFGSYSTDARTDFKTTLRLDVVGNSTVGTREVRVIDNTGSTSDVTRFSGSILGTAFTTFNKAGDGVLELTATNNRYAGPTLVSAGALLVNGGLVSGGDTVTVTSGGTLGGTGTVARAVAVAAGGALAAGAQASGDVGVLTVNGDVTLAENARLLCDFGGATNDRVHVNGTLTLPVSATVVVSPLGTPANVHPRVLFTATTLAGASGDLTQWVLSDPKIGRIATQGNSVVMLARPNGLALIIR